MHRLQELVRLHRLGEVQPLPVSRPADASQARRAAAAAAAETDAEAICAALPDGPEMALERLGAARERWPEDPRLASVWALRAAGFAAQGLRELEVFAAAHPADSETLALWTLGGLALDGGDPGDALPG